MNLLIVEDDAMVRHLLVRHFKKRHSVTGCAAAEEALRIFEESSTPFDVVITDVHLPGMTGLDLATRIRGKRPDQPIVFVTGDVDEQLARRALESGGAGYLLKPFEFFELDAAIEQAIKTPAQAQPTPLTSEIKLTDDWYELQRQQLLAAASRPISLKQEYVPVDRLHPIRRYIKLAIAIAALIALAWFVGYQVILSPEARTEQDPPAARERTIYVPYQPPESDRRRDSRDDTRRNQP